MIRPQTEAFGDPLHIVRRTAEEYSAMTVEGEDRQIADRVLLARLAFGVAEDGADGPCFSRLFVQLSALPKYSTPRITKPSFSSFRATCMRPGSIAVQCP